MSVDGSGVISDGVENTYVSFNYPQTGTTQLTDAPGFTQRTESSEGVTGNYGYSSSEDTVAKRRHSQYLALMGLSYCSRVLPTRL